MKKCVNSQNLFKRTELFKKKLDDIITLIKISYAQKTNNYEFDCDIMESTLAEFIKIVRNLLEANSINHEFVYFKNSDHTEISKKDDETQYNNLINKIINWCDNL